MQIAFRAAAAAIALTVSGASAQGAAHSAPATPAAAPRPGDIVATAVAAGSFTTLARALEVAGLVETLQGKGPFTVFAPTDAAFAKIPKATLDALLADREKLTQVLTYHVVPGRVTARQVAQMPSAKTVSGKSVRIRASGGKVMIDDATVTQADVAATNGVIHAIDTVLMPE